MPVRQRGVRYTNIATNNRGLTSISFTEGYETVEERPYCFEHSRTVVPAVVGRTNKTFHYMSTDPQKFKDD